MEARNTTRMGFTSSSGYMSAQVHRVHSRSFRFFSDLDIKSKSLSFGSLKMFVWVFLDQGSEILWSQQELVKRVQEVDKVL